MSQTNNEKKPFKQPSLAKQLSFAERLTQNAHGTKNTLPTNTPIEEFKDKESIQLTTIIDTNEPTPGNHENKPSFVGLDETSKQKYHSNMTSKTMSSQIDFNVINSNPDNNLYIILYYVLRILTVIVTLFLAIMAINYAIGQVFSLSAADLFCQDYSEDTIRQYNKKNNYPTGSDLECNRIHRPEIDEHKVRFGDPFESVTDFVFGNVISCVAFALLATCLTILGFLHAYTCFYDGYYHFVKKDAANNPRIVNISNSIRPQSNNTIVKLYKKWNLLLFKYYYPDSQFKVISMVISELSEILMQCWALLIYGGVQSVSFTFVVANEPIFVQSFALIIGLDAISVGILWLLYVIKFNEKWTKINLNAIFHGTSFQSIVFVVDMIFDFVYTIFPFTLYSGNASLLFNIKALATLHSENGILFFAAFIAMCLLLQKCYSVLYSFDPVEIERRARKIVDQEIELIPFIQTEYISTSTNNTNNTNIKDTNEYKTWKSQQLKRRIAIGCIGILFLIFGFGIIISVHQYINNGYETCSNPSQTILSEHPELYYWNDNCHSKLIPFDSYMTHCDCREFDIVFTPKHYNEYNFTQQHIISIMSNFKMMTYLNMEYSHEMILIVDHMIADGQLQLAKELFYLNLTKECFLSKKLNVLNLYRLYLIDLDWSSLSQLKLLQILEIHNAIFENPVNWDNIGSLTNLKYLNLRESTRFLSGEISDGICNLKQLRYLDIQTNEISKIPDCIGTLTELHGVNLRGSWELKYITPDIFHLPKIESIVAYFSGFKSSIIPNNGTWSKSLKTVFLGDNPLCKNLNTLSNASLLFIDHFDACFSPCSSIDCSAYEWGNGDCDSECCNFDGGDCH
eukprot:147322_1